MSHLKSKTKKLTDKQVTHITKIIQREVGYFNGWSVSNEAEEKACRLAATKALKYIIKKLGE